MRLKDYNERDGKRVWLSEKEIQTLLAHQDPNHPDTGEERTKSHHVVGVVEPIEKFDSEGVLWDRIPPKPGTDVVVNPDREFQGDTATVVIGDKDEDNHRNQDTWCHTN